MLIEVMKFIRSGKPQELELLHIDINILIVIADMMGKNQNCWPSEKELIRVCNTSKATLYRRFAVLKRLELIKITSRKGKKTLYSIPENLNNNLPTRLTHETSLTDETRLTGETSNVQTRLTGETAIDKSNHQIKIKQSPNKHTARSRVLACADSIFFDEFIQAYPRKEGVANAFAYWIKNNLDDIGEKIVSYVKTKNQRNLWPKEKRYIPSAANFLKEQRYHDPIMEKQDDNVFGNNAKDGKVSLSAYLARLETEEVHTKQPCEENFHDDECNVLAEDRQAVLAGWYDRRSHEDVGDSDYWH